MTCVNVFINILLVKSEEYTAVLPAKEQTIRIKFMFGRCSTAHCFFNLDNYGFIEYVPRLGDSPCATQRGKGDL